MGNRNLAFLTFLVFIAPLSLGQGSAPTLVKAQAAPERPIIEVRDGMQSVNFDMEITSHAVVPLLISSIEVSVFDSGGRLELRKSINTDAFAPSVEVIGPRLLLPGKTLDVFNPFYEFQPEVMLTEVRYSFCFLQEANEMERDRNRHRLPGDCDVREELTVRPRTYEGKTSLILPLRGRVFVWEGHDFLAHHLRVPLGQPEVQELGITANSNEFASDFIFVDEQGKPYHDDPRKLENWYSYGRPIYAPGAGVVMAAANDIPDNWFKDAKAAGIGHPELAAGKDPKDIGNFVLIDHLDGEYSLLIHMKPRSVMVKAGDRVESGQAIGAIGFAGDSIFPHLHYALMDGPEVFKAWGLPAYFSHFQRIVGGRSVKVDRGPVNSGEFIESDSDSGSRRP